MSTRGRPSRLVIYERLDMQIAELWQRMGGLPSPAEAGDIWRNIWYQEAHHSLRAAAVRGRLQATKGPDGQWRSTRNWVNRYLSTRYRRP